MLTNCGYRNYFRTLPIALFILVSTAASVHAVTQEVSIGVLSHRGMEYTTQHWQPTADYLTQTIPGYSFSITPLEFGSITQSIELEFVDFLLVNPGIYVVLEVSHGISRLATLNNRVGEQALNQFGSVIFSRSDRHDITTLADLRNKWFMAVDETSLGGFQMAWGELQQVGINPYRDFATFHFGGSHDNVVMAVLDGLVDAGAVRTDILERMAQQGTITMQQIKVIHPQKDKNFPFVHSTQLYPEWPFSKMSHTSNVLAQKVAVALLNMPANHPAALAGLYAGWTVPLDYQSVHDLFRKLHLPPYALLQEFTISDVVQRYLLWIVLSFALFVLFASMTYWIWCLNRKLYRTNQSLEQQHLLILNSVADGIYGVDNQGNATFANRAMQQMTGWSAAEIVGNNQHQLLHHSHSDGSPFPIEQCPVYATCHDGVSRFVAEDIFWCKDGSNIAVEYGCSPLLDEHGKSIGSVVIFRDIRARKQAAELQRQHQLELAHIGRINTMGEMAAGIAHEINQPLAAISANAQACIRFMDAGMDQQSCGKVSDALDTIAMQAQRGGDIIRQLRQFVKKEQPQKALLDINELVQKVVLLIGPEAQRQEVQVVTNLQPDIVPVAVQDIQIQQVIINLATNAIDAMQSEGVTQRVLTISTLQRSSDEVVVQVADTGIGVAPELQTELFKQFITTKTKGMGLGLSISQGIIEAHDGVLSLLHSSGSGTLFQFTLPAANSEKDKNS